MAETIRAAASRLNLDHAIKHTEPHLRPVLEAIRDLRLAMMFVPQVAEPFRIPRNAHLPTLTIVGDDFDSALGPDAFHMPSLRRAVRTSKAFAVVSSAATVDVYSCAVQTAAILRVNTLLVETRPEQEIPWLALIQQLAPRRPIWLSTVEGGHA